MEVHNKTNSSSQRFSNIVISASNNSSNHYTKGWNKYIIEDKEDFLNLITTRAYSNSIFNYTHYRKNENVLGYGSCIIFDVDNDADTANITMQEAKNILTTKNIFSLIIPSRSHLLDKGKNGIKDRFRIFIFLNDKSKIPSDISKEAYKNLINNIALELDLDKYIDPRALDISRLYYPTPENHKKSAIEIPGNNFSIENSLKEALKVDITLFKNPFTASSLSSQQYSIHHYIYSYDYEEINIKADFPALISYAESINYSNQSGSKIKIKTNSHNTYQFFTDTNLLYDFKKMKTFKPVSYIKHILNIDKTPEEIEKIENILNQEFKKLNRLWSDSFVKAMNTAKNHKELTILLKEYTGFKKITVNNTAEDKIVIGGRSFHIKELGTDYTTLSSVIKKFISNRIDS